MPRKFEVDKINLEVLDIVPFKNERGMGFVIEWDSDIGWGEYTVFTKADSDKWCGDSEHMDNNEDKSFLKELLKIFVEELDIVD